MRTERELDVDVRVGGDGHARTEGFGDGAGDRHAALEAMPTKDLLTELFGQAKVLLKEEVRLAKAEIRQEAKRAGVSAGLMGGGTVMLHTGFLALGAFLIALLALWMPVWASALIVTVLFLAVGGGLAMAGAKKIKKVDLKPEETLETLKEDKEWARSVMRGATSNRRATV